MAKEFQECAACAAKPGDPELCAACRNNREIIQGCYREIEAWSEKMQLLAFAMTNFAPDLTADLILRYDNASKGSLQNFVSYLRSP